MLGQKGLCQVLVVTHLLAQPVGILILILLQIYVAILTLELSANALTHPAGKLIQLINVLSNKG
jgi:hypothetical protein